MANNRKGKSQLVTFLYIMWLTAYRIDNDKKLLPSLLKMFSMFKIKCWYSPGEVDNNTVETNL